MTSGVLFSDSLIRSSNLARAAFLPFRPSGQRSPLITAEYWRWWVVHLWVEGFFEVFATVVIAFLLTRLKLLSVSTATRSVLFSTVIYLSGGIIGTFHHLYFSGAPNSVLALGAVFSALEVVPLVLIGFEAWENIRLLQGTADGPWISAYKWPIYLLRGRRILELCRRRTLWVHDQSAHRPLLRPRIELDAGTRTRCSVRGIWHVRPWPNAVLPACAAAGSDVERPSVGDCILVAQHRSGTDDPHQHAAVGLLQAWASVEYGTWFARSAEFMQTPLVNRLRWMRMFGDTLFAFGALVLGWFVLGLITGHSFDRTATLDEGEYSPRPVGVKIEEEVTVGDHFLTTCRWESMYPAASPLRVYPATTVDRRWFPILH